MKPRDANEDPPVKPHLLRCPFQKSFPFAGGDTEEEFVDIGKRIPFGQSVLGVGELEDPDKVITQHGSPRTWEGIEQDDQTEKCRLPEMQSSPIVVKPCEGQEFFRRVHIGTYEDLRISAASVDPIDGVSGSTKYACEAMREGSVGFGIQGTPSTGIESELGKRQGRGKMNARNRRNRTIAQNGGPNWKFCRGGGSGTITDFRNHATFGMRKSSKMLVRGNKIDLKRPKKMGGEVDEPWPPVDSSAKRLRPLAIEGEQNGSLPHLQIHANAMSAETINDDLHGVRNLRHEG